MMEKFEGTFLMFKIIYVIFIIYIDIDTYWHVTIMWLYLSNLAVTCQVEDIVIDAT